MHRGGKKIFQRLGALFATTAFVLLILTIGFHFASKQQRKDLIETPRLAHIISKNQADPKVFIFFKKGCPYCRSAKNDVLKESKKAMMPVYFVDTDSEVGKKLVSDFKIKYASTISVVSNKKVTNYPYADKINGKITPLRANIKVALGAKK